MAVAPNQVPVLGTITVQVVPPAAGNVPAVQVHSTLDLAQTIGILRTALDTAMQDALKGIGRPPKGLLVPRGPLPPIPPQEG